MRHELSREEKILGGIIAVTIMVVFVVGLYFEYTWWRGASIVTAVGGMAIIFLAFKFYARKARGEQSSISNGGR